jgi:hypothetical protein
MKVMIASLLGLLAGLTAFAQAPRDPLKPSAILPADLSSLMTGVFENSDYHRGRANIDR